MDADTGAARPSPRRTEGRDLGPWMIYGANGYTGTLIAEEAKRRGMGPILAGRREGLVRPLAERLGLPYRIFSLESPGVVAGNISGVDAVLLTAGPFSETSRPVLEACLATGAHYLDITGEIEVFEACRARGEDARRGGSVVLPGVGMDVVPTDCLAASLRAALQDADRLEMAFAGLTSFSRGTMITMLDSLPKGGAVRENGRIVTVPTAWKTALIPFRDRPRWAASIPWGDVSTAYYSTGIPNIVFYMAMPRAQVALIRTLAALLKVTAVRTALQSVVKMAVRGPGAAFREKSRLQIWGRASNPRGEAREATLETPNSYELTVLTALESISRVLSKRPPPGFYTPAAAFGARYITEFPGCDLRISPPPPG